MGFSGDETTEVDEDAEDARPSETRPRSACA
jgi:hypothetical protein